MTSRLTSALLVQTVASLLLSVSANAVSTRVSYNPKHLDVGTVEVDLVGPCASRKESCTVSVPNGPTITVSGGVAATFTGTNPPDAIISDRGKNQMVLQANACIDVSAPFTIESFAWKAGDGQEAFAPSGYDEGSGTYKKSVPFNQEPGILSPSGSPSHICIKPKEKTSFTVLWVRLNPSKLAPPATDVSFSENMKRASAFLLSSLQLAFGETRTLEDPDTIGDAICHGHCTDGDKANIAAIIQQLTPLDSAIEAAIEQIDPAQNNSGQPISVARPEVRDAIRTIESAYAYAAPMLERIYPTVDTPKIDKKAKDNAGIAMAVEKVSFKRNLKWLREDLESYEIYDEKVEARSPADLLAGIIAGRLATVRSALGDPETVLAATGESNDYHAILDPLQSRAQELSRAARGPGGDTGPDASKAMNEFFAIWNAESTQALLLKAWNVDGVMNHMKVLDDAVKNLATISGAQYRSPLKSKSQS